MSGAVSWAEAGDISSARSFQVGEQLTYDISWLNITAGTAVMAVTVRWYGRRPAVGEIDHHGAVEARHHQILSRR